MQLKNMKIIIQKLIDSFDNKPNGFSARKLSAFIAIIIALYITINYIDNTTLINALMVCLTFALLCLGIITAEQILKFTSEKTKQE